MGELAERMKVNVDKVQQVKSVAMINKTVSVNTGDAPDPRRRPLDQLTSTVLKEAVNSFLDDLLEDREAQVLRMRFGLALDERPYGCTLQEIADALRVTPETVRSIQRRAQQKLRDAPL